MGWFQSYSDNLSYSDNPVASYKNLNESIFEIYKKNI